MAEVQWEALNREQQQLLYPRLVHQVFEMTPAASPAESAAVLPPGLSLELAQIEITTFCNLSCRECGRTKAVNRGTWSNNHMRLTDFITIAGKLPPSKRIYLQGVGEPSMHPHFLEMIAYAYGTGKFSAICFNTNALTHKDDYWLGMAESYPTVLPAVSVDSFDETIAQQCRAGTNAHLLRSRVALFQKAFRTLTVSLVASTMNLEDIPVTIAKLSAMGPLEMSIQPIITDDASIALTADGKKRVQEIVAWTAREHPHITIYPDVEHSNLKRCVRPFLAPFITIEGYLTPCCSILDPQPYKWTSLLGEASWDQVRSSSGVMEWMSRYVTTDAEQCVGCTFNPRQASNTRDYVAVHFSGETA